MKATKYQSVQALPRSNLTSRIEVRFYHFSNVTYCFDYDQVYFTATWIKTQDANATDLPLAADHCDRKGDS